MALVIKLFLGKNVGDLVFCKLDKDRPSAGAIKEVYIDLIYSYEITRAYNYITSIVYTKCGQISAPLFCKFRELADVGIIKIHIPHV